MNVHDYVTVISSCNRYDFLRQAVLSALTQTLPPRAVWVVDDASTDPRYLDCGDELSDPSVRVIRRPVNSKAETGTTYANGTARNTALVELLASPFDGWVHFLDDDDVWRPDKAEFTAGFVGPDTAAIGTDATVIAPGGEPIGFYGPVGGEVIDDDLIDVTDVVRTNNPLTLSTVAMPMRVIRQIGLMRSTGYCEDWDFWYRASAHGRLLRLTLDLAFYRKGHAKEWSL